MANDPQFVRERRRTASREAGGPGRMVLVAATEPSHRKQLRAVAASCGVQSQEVADVCNVRQKKASFECSVALVMMPPDFSASAPELDAVRSLQQNGFLILACAEGSQSVSYTHLTLPTNREV